MCTKCTKPVWDFGLDFYAAKFGQMEGGAYVYVVVSVFQCIAE